MNWKRLIIWITIVNLLGWGLIELWAKRYASMSISGAAAFLIGFHLTTYYLIVLASLPSSKKDEKEKITPVNCPSHDWQRHKYGNNQEQCTKCGAERGTKY